MVAKELIIDEFKLLLKKLRNDVSLLEAKSDKKDKKDKTDINALNFKIRNFVKVIKNLELFDNPVIEKAEDVKDLDGIGKGTLARIDEIIKKGHLEEAHQTITTEEEEIAKQISDLTSVTGIGPAKAVDLQKKGITLSKLLEEYKHKSDSIEESEILKILTHHQLIGLKYYKQFQKRIPRDKITKIDLKIQKLMSKFLKNNKIMDEITTVICGSYRRGLPESGDIDLLISGNTTKFDLIEFVKFLTDEELIIDHLTEKGTTKFMGVCDKRGGYRIDIRFIPSESFGAALMYFTGSKTFNTLVRAEALRQGYTLEEYGLYPLIKADSDALQKKKASSHQHLKGDIIPCPTEETIFNILKIDKKYIDPRLRDLKENDKL
jgi:DNA polymerase beta